MKRHTIFSSIAVLSLAAQLGAQTSAWIPAPGTVNVTPMFGWQSFQDIRAGSTPVRLGESVRQSTGAVSVEAGVARNVAVDVTAGYSNVNSRAFGGDNSDRGMTDTRFGVRWTMANGSRNRPVFGVRLGGIVRGTYQPNYPFSAGDGGSGIETSILAGQTFGESGFSAFGDIGYRYRNRGIPPDMFGSVGVQKALGKISLGAAYRQGRGLGGSNIGDPGFSFPGLRQIEHAVEGNIGFSDSHRRGYYFFVARTMGGRNTGQAVIAGIAAQFSFRLPWRR